MSDRDLILDVIAAQVSHYRLGWGIGKALDLVRALESAGFKIVRAGDE